MCNCTCQPAPPVLMEQGSCHSCGPCCVNNGHGSSSAGDGVGWGRGGVNLSPLWRGNLYDLLQRVLAKLNPAPGDAVTPVGTCRLQGQLVSQEGIGNGLIRLTMATTGSNTPVEYSLDRRTWQDSNVLEVAVPPLNVTVFMREKQTPTCETALLLALTAPVNQSITITDIRYKDGLTIIKLSNGYCYIAPAGFAGTVGVAFNLATAQANGFVSDANCLLFTQASTTPPTTATTVTGVRYQGGQVILKLSTNVCYVAPAGWTGSVGDVFNVSTAVANGFVLDTNCQRYNQGSTNPVADAGTVVIPNASCDAVNPTNIIAIDFQYQRVGSAIINGQSVAYWFIRLNKNDTNGLEVSENGGAYQAVPAAQQSAGEVVYHYQHTVIGASAGQVRSLVFRSVTLRSQTVGINTLIPSADASRKSVALAACAPAYTAPSTTPTTPTVIAPALACPFGNIILKAQDGQGTPFDRLSFSIPDDTFTGTPVLAYGLFDQNTGEDLTVANESGFSDGRVVLSNYRSVEGETRENPYTLILTRFLPAGTRSLKLVAYNTAGQAEYNFQLIVQARPVVNNIGRVSVVAQRLADIVTKSFNLTVNAEQPITATLTAQSTCNTTPTQTGPTTLNGTDYTKLFQNLKGGLYKLKLQEAGGTFTEQTIDLSTYSSGKATSLSPAKVVAPTPVTYSFGPHYEPVPVAGPSPLNEYRTEPGMFTSVQEGNLAQVVLQRRYSDGTWKSYTDDRVYSITNSVPTGITISNGGVFAVAANSISTNVAANVRALMPGNIALDFTITAVNVAPTSPTPTNTYRVAAGSVATLTEGGAPGQILLERQFSDGSWQAYTGSATYTIGTPVAGITVSGTGLVTVGTDSISANFTLSVAVGLPGSVIYTVTINVVNVSPSAPLVTNVYRVAGDSAASVTEGAGPGQIKLERQYTDSSWQPFTGNQVYTKTSGPGTVSASGVVEVPANTINANGVIGVSVALPNNTTFTLNVNAINVNPAPDPTPVVSQVAIYKNGSGQIAFIYRDGNDSGVLLDDKWDHTSFDPWLPATYYEAGNRVALPTGYKDYQHYSSYGTLPTSEESSLLTQTTFSLRRRDTQAVLVTFQFQLTSALNNNEVRVIYPATA